MSKKVKNQEIQNTSMKPQGGQKTSRRKISSKALITVAVAFLLAVFAFFLFYYVSNRSTEPELSQDLVTEANPEVVEELYVEEEGGGATVEILEDGFSPYFIFITDTATITWKNVSNQNCDLGVVVDQSGEVLLSELVSPEDEAQLELTVTDQVSFECTADQRRGGFIRTF